MSEKPLSVLQSEQAQNATKQGVSLLEEAGKSGTSPIEPWQDRGSDSLPQACGNCAHWLRCKGLIHDLAETAPVCDFEPSRYRLGVQP